MLVVQRSLGPSGDSRYTVLTASGTCQVVLPKDLRERAGIRPGQHIRVLSLGSRLEMVPVEPVRCVRGALEGIPGELEGRPEDAR